MDEHTTSMHDEDLSVDESDAEGVTGGQRHRGPQHMTSVRQAEADGYAEVACTREGTLMRKGTDTVTIPY